MRALARGGVEYVEVRALDICIFEPTGVCTDEMHFMEAFLALCLARSSDPIERRRSRQQLDHNHLLVARRGREPDLQLQRDGRAVSLKAWGAELLDQLGGICELLDADDPAPTLPARARQAAGEAARPGAHALGATPAGAAPLGQPALPSTRSRCPASTARGCSRQPATIAALQAQFAAEAAASLLEQEALERDDRGSFEDYLAHALGPDPA